MAPWLTYLDIKVLEVGRPLFMTCLDCWEFSSGCTLSCCKEPFLRLGWTVGSLPLRLGWTIGHPFKALLGSLELRLGLVAGSLPLKLRLVAKSRGRRKYSNEIPWQCSWRSSGELSGAFCLETPHFHVWFPHIAPNCSRERSPQHCHSKSFLVPERALL